MINLGTTEITGRYRIISKNKETNEINFDTDWNDNLVTNIGKEEFSKGLISSLWITLGTKNTPAAVSDVRLAAPFYSVQMASVSSSITEESDGYYRDTTMTFYVEGSDLGTSKNVTELGLCNKNHTDTDASNPYKLLTRVLTRAGGGSGMISAVTIKPEDSWTILYNVRYKVKYFKQPNQTMQVNGKNYTVSVYRDRRYFDNDILSSPENYGVWGTRSYSGSAGYYWAICARVIKRADPDTLVNNSFEFLPSPIGKENSTVPITLLKKDPISIQVIAGKKYVVSKLYLTPEWMRELKKVQDAAPTEPLDVVICPFGTNEGYRGYPSGSYTGYAFNSYYIVISTGATGLIEMPQGSGLIIEISSEIV